MTAAPPPSAPLPRAAPGGAMPLLAGLVLLAATGFVDAYTFLAHGHVFAEAMTGNLVLIGVGLVEPSVVAPWRPLLTFAAFVAGLTVVWLLARRSTSRQLQVLTLGVMVAVLVVAGFLPAAVPDAAVAGAIAFAAGLQITAFDRIGPTRLTTIVMTSNSRAAVAATLHALSTRSRYDTVAAARLLGALLAFVVGAVLGALVTRALDVRAAWPAAALFLLAGVVHLAAPPTAQPARDGPVSSARPLDG